MHYDRDNKQRPVGLEGREFVLLDNKTLGVITHDSYDPHDGIKMYTGKINGNFFLLYRHQFSIDKRKVARAKKG